VADLGNFLVPGLFSSDERGRLGGAFSGLKEDVKVKELPDASVVDLHRKGLATVASLLIFGAAVSQMASVFPAVLAFSTGLGLTMGFFRLQGYAARRDAFFRAEMARWIALSEARPPRRSDGAVDEGGDQDPFYLLRRDYALHHLTESRRALEAETGGDPHADIVILLAQSKEEARFFEEQRQDPRLFRAETPVVVLPLRSGAGTFSAYAEAWLYVRDHLGDHPSLRGKKLSEVRVAALVSRSGQADRMSRRLSDMETFNRTLPFEALGDTTVFALQVANVYRALSDRDPGNGALAFRWADRPVVGPIRAARKPGITLDVRWANLDEMEYFGLGAVIAPLGRSPRLIRRNDARGTLATLAKQHKNRNYDQDNPGLRQVQAFPGEGVFAFNEDGHMAVRHANFLEDIVARYEVLSRSAAESGHAIPKLNLMTYYLVPLSIARENKPRKAGKAIHVYFSKHGFYNGSLPVEVQKFNQETANKLVEFTQGSGALPLYLNPAVPDEILTEDVSGPPTDPEPEMVAHADDREILSPRHPLAVLGASAAAVIGTLNAATVSLLSSVLPLAGQVGWNNAGGGLAMAMGTALIALLPTFAWGVLAPGGGSVPYAFVGVLGGGALVGLALV
jgi:hypothetical protein